MFLKIQYFGMISPYCIQRLSLIQTPYLTTPPQDYICWTQEEKSYNPEQRGRQL